MSRLNAPGVRTGAPENNVYTAMAFISMVVTLVALIYVVMRFLDLGVFK